MKYKGITDELRINEKVDFRDKCINCYFSLSEIKKSTLLVFNYSQEMNVFVICIIFISVYEQIVAKDPSGQPRLNRLSYHPHS